MTFDGSQLFSGSGYTLDWEKDDERQRNRRVPGYPVETSEGHFGFKWFVIFVVVMMMYGSAVPVAPRPKLRMPDYLSYVHLVPSLPSMGKILVADEDFIRYVGVSRGLGPSNNVCPALDDEIFLQLDPGFLGLDPPEPLAMTPWFRGVDVNLSYEDPANPYIYLDQNPWNGEVLVMQSPVRDSISGKNYDFMALVDGYPCQDSVDSSTLPAQEVAATYHNPEWGVSFIARVEGLPADMVGYWRASTPSTTDPVFQTSAPVWTLGGSGSLEVYAQSDGYFVRVHFEGYSVDPSQSVMSLDAVVAFVRAVQDRVRENRVEVEGDHPIPATCRDVISYMREDDPEASDVNGCVCDFRGCWY